MKHYLILVGLNHQTAPVSIREEFAAIADCGLRMSLQDIDQECLLETIILSTCNRFEIYAICASLTQGKEIINQFVASLQENPFDQLQPHLYYKENETAVQHLMNVAAGLDSMILGEPQILGQVNRAYEEANHIGTTGPILSHLFSQAIHAGKRARHETEISRHTTSISHAAVKLIEQQLGSLSALNLLLIGAGEMAEQAAMALQVYGIKQISFINRTFNRANQLAEKFQATAVSWPNLEKALIEADVVIAATGAPHLILYEQDILKILPARKERPLFLMDISLPRNIDPHIKQLPHIHLYDIDDLQATVDENLARRQAEIPNVAAILSDEINSFLDWWQSRQILPVLTALRTHGHTIADAEIHLALRKLPPLDAEAEAIIYKMGHRIINKLLHSPTIQLKEQANNPQTLPYPQLVRNLFALPLERDLEQH